MQLGMEFDFLLLGYITRVIRCLSSVSSIISSIDAYISSETLNLYYDEPVHIEQKDLTYDLFPYTPSICSLKCNPSSLLSNLHI